jgi:deazaflavin-dependent oxidoreductase (nitroreductase family)
MARKPPPSSSRKWKVVNAAGRLNILVYRLSGGRIGGKMGKAPILILHHRGRNTGKERATPVLYLADGNDLVVVGSKGGTDKDPHWFRNLIAGGETEVEVGRDRRRVRPRLAEPAERERLWPRLVDMYPDYAEYQTFTDRTIPVAILEPT